MPVCFSNKEKTGSGEAFMFLASKWWRHCRLAFVVSLVASFLICDVVDIWKCFFLDYELWHWNFFTEIWKWIYFKSDFICAQKINTNTNTATAKKTVPISGIICHSFNAIIASLTPTITRKLLPRNLLITYFLLSLSFRFFFARNATRPTWVSQSSCCSANRTASFRQSFRR